jgi:hypothetical protein
MSEGNRWNRPGGYDEVHPLDQNNEAAPHSQPGTASVCCCGGCRFPGLRMYIPTPLDGMKTIPTTMRTHYISSFIILLCTVAIFLIIIVGAALPPKNTHPSVHIRFVSDGFEDYPQLVVMCFVFLLIAIMNFWRFAQAAAFAVPDTKTRDDSGLFGKYDHWIVFLFGGVSLTGFVLLAMFPSGNTHLIGAFLFIAAYIVMQWQIDIIMWRVHQTSWGPRALEYGIIMVAIISALLFAGFMVIGLIAEGHQDELTGTFYSASAIAEYVLFAAFIGCTLYGVSMMTYICTWFTTENEIEKTGEGGSVTRLVWKKRNIPQMSAGGRGGY